MKEPEVEVLKPEEMSDQEMADLCEEETKKQLKLIYKDLTRKLFEQDLIMAVNAAGNYTKPSMRKSLFNRIKAGGKGGKPGQWSARKAQMLARMYKAKGGGYT